MKTVIIHGQSHKGSTYHIAHELAEKIGGEITEFFLPRDFGKFCLGCTNCFMNSEKKCPHYESLAPITQAIDAADVIILASPVYVYHVTGAMKAFLDHYGYRWLVHCPESSMFRKQGVCIATAAGAGVKSTLKDMSHSLFFWGVARIYQYGLGVASTNWDIVRACLVSSENDADKSKRNHLKRILKKSLTIFPNPTAFIKPAKGSFHNPTFWENNKSVEFAAFNYFDFST